MFYVYIYLTVHTAVYGTNKISSICIMFYSNCTYTAVHGCKSNKICFICLKIQQLMGFKHISNCTVFRLERKFIF